MQIPLKRKEKELLQRLRDWNKKFSNLEEPVHYAIKIAESMPDLFKVIETMEREYATTKLCGEAAIEMHKKAKREEHNKRRDNYNKFHRKLI
jgi:hypothetical protein